MFIVIPTVVKHTFLISVYGGRGPRRQPQLKEDPELGEREPHRALVWLLARVSAHVDHQHVLGFEGPQLPGAAPPVAHELLPLPMDVLAVDVLREEVQRLSEALLCLETLTSLP